jgi:hypothetical protein
LDNTRRGALSYNQLRPSSRSHGSFARVELDTSSTVSANSILRCSFSLSMLTRLSIAPHLRTHRTK